MIRPKYGEYPRVVWHYRHHTNSTTSFIRAKHGEYIGAVRYHVNKYYGPLYIHPELVVVRFDGNKGFSKVKLSELELENE